MFYKNLINLRAGLVKSQIKNIKFNTRNSSSSNSASPPVKRSWSKIALISTGVPISLAFSYYHLALNSKEQRWVRVNLNSIGRAFRSAKQGAQILADYKWNLWNLDKVVIINFEM